MMQKHNFALTLVLIAIGVEGRSLQGNFKNIKGQISAQLPQLIADNLYENIFEESDNNDFKGKFSFFSDDHDFEVENDFEVEGDFEEEGDFEVDGDFEVEGDFEEEGDFEVQGDFEVDGDFEEEGDFEVQGDFEVNIKVDHSNDNDLENIAIGEIAYIAIPEAVEGLEIAMEVDIEERVVKIAQVPATACRCDGEHHDH